MDKFIIDWNSLLCVIVGGIVTLIATVICNEIQNKKMVKIEKEKEKNEIRRWVRDKKEYFYMQLSGLLDNINVEIDSDTMKPVPETIYQNIRKLNDWINENRGLISLYLPSDIYSEVVRLQGELFSTYDNEENQDFQNVLQCCAHARKIQFLLRKDLYDKALEDN